MQLRSATAVVLCYVLHGVAQLHRTWPTLEGALGVKSCFREDLLAARLRIMFSIASIVGLLPFPLKQLRFYEVSFTPAFPS